MATVEIFSKKDKLKQQEKTFPRVVTSFNKFLELRELVKSTDLEIMLFGVVKKHENNLYIIEEWLIPPQDSNTSTFVTTNDDEYPKWLLDIPREKRINIRMHLHTHPKMSVSPSGVDEETIINKVQDIDNFYLRAIINHDLKLRLDLFNLEEERLYKHLNLEIIYKKGTPLKLLMGPDGLELVNLLDFTNEKEELKKQMKSKSTKVINTLGHHLASGAYYGYPQEEEEGIQNPYTPRTIKDEDLEEEPEDPKKKAFIEKWFPEKHPLHDLIEDILKLYEYSLENKSLSLEALEEEAANLSMEAECWLAYLEELIDQLTTKDRRASVLLYNESISRWLEKNIPTIKEYRRIYK